MDVNHDDCFILEDAFDQQKNDDDLIVVGEIMQGFLRRTCRRISSQTYYESWLMSQRKIPRDVSDWQSELLEKRYRNDICLRKKQIVVALRMSFEQWFQIDAHQWLLSSNYWAIPFANLAYRLKYIARLFKRHHPDNWSRLKLIEGSMNK